jgi:hypothetical protein
MEVRFRSICIVCGYQYIYIYILIDIYGYSMKRMEREMEVRFRSLCIICADIYICV